MSRYYDEIINRFEIFFESPVQDFNTYIKQKQSQYRYTCIWGVGNLGRPTAVEFKKRGLKVDFYCDNNKEKWGNEYDGIECITPQRLSEIKEDTWIIICARAFKEIYAQLEGMGYPHIDRVFMNKFLIREYLEKCEKKDLYSNIQNLLNICEDDMSKKVVTTIILEWLNNESGNLSDICSEDQYFCEDILNIADNEVFIDGGAYNGDTLQEYLKVKGNHFEKLILFELSKGNFDALENNVNLLNADIKDKIFLYNKGISDKDAEIWYEELDEGCSEEKTGTTKGYLATIDNVCGDDKITYIKMDIEGSELAALKGARKCILAYKPKLAVCLYHKPWDLWEIPLYIKEILPEYKIYIRHHTDLLNETVCYAVV